MKLKKIFLITLALSLYGVSNAQTTSEWPEKPVKVVVPGGSGGVLDTLARQIYSRLEEKLGQSFIIDNKPGANGLIGSSIVNNAPKDGYTLLHSTASSMVMAEALNENIKVKTLKDLEPVALIATGGVLLVTHPSVPANSLPELIELIKKTLIDTLYLAAGALAQMGI